MLRFKSEIYGDKVTGGSKSIGDGDKSKMISVKILTDFDRTTNSDAELVYEQLVDDPMACHHQLPVTENYTTDDVTPSENTIIESSAGEQQIIYLTYPMDNLQVIENLDDGQDTAQMDNTRHHQQMIITMPNMNEKLNVLDSDGNINEIHQIGNVTGNNIMFQLHATGSTATEDDQGQPSSGEIDKDGIYNHENQQIELITSDGQTVRLLNYGNPIDLDSDFII